MELLRKIGYLTWLVLLALSLIFYRERAFFMDAGFQLFNLINEQKIQVYHYRFVTAIPQVVPFLLMKMGAPLWALAMGFSAAYILFYFAIWHLLVRYLRCEVLGWVLLSLLLLMTFDGFYHIQSEFNLGLALLLLAFGIVLRNEALNKTRQWAALLPLIATIGFSHKLSIIFTVFLWVFLFVKNKELRHWRYGMLLGVFMVATGIKSAFFTNWYEAAKQAEFAVNLKEYFPRLWAIPSNLVFAERCLHYYYMWPLLIGIVSIFYLRKKAWLRLGLVWSFSLGYLLLYNIADPQAHYRFYSEVSYLPLSIFVATPFFFDALPFSLPPARATAFRKFQTFGKLSLVLVLFLRLATIAWNHRTVAGQFAWIEQQIDRPGNRFLLPENQAPLDTVLMTWGVPFTAMHLSALESPDSAKTLLILPDFQWFEDKMGREDVFFSPFHKVLGKGELNGEYYRLSTGFYQDIGIENPNLSDPDSVMMSVASSDFMPQAANDSLQVQNSKLKKIKKRPFENDALLVPSDSFPVNRTLKDSLYKSSEFSKNIPLDSIQETGSIAIHVCINRIGEVISAEYSPNGSTSSSKKLIDISIENVKKYKFSTGNREVQCGTVTYTFKVK